MPVRPLLAFPPGSIEARIVRREKRFLVHVETVHGRLVAHTNNSGSMLGLLRTGARAYLSRSDNPKRTLPYTLELVEVHGGWVGVNTLTPNRMLAAAWRQGLLPELAGYAHFQPEAKVGQSRIDCRLWGGPEGRTENCPECWPECWVEAKNVTMVEDDVACFPDAITERGQKHLRELMGLARTGARVAVFYLVQRPDGACFGPADFIDPAYGELFWESLAAGVEAWPYRAVVTTDGIGLGERLPLARRDCLPG